MHRTGPRLIPLIVSVLFLFAPALALAKEEAQASQLSLDDIRAFTDAFERIKREYVEDIDDRELMEAAIRGMLSELDPHSAYLNAEEHNELEDGTQGRFGGIGIEVQLTDGLVEVIAPIEGTPAHVAGLKPGDLIVEIDGEQVLEMGLGEAIERIRGEPGTDVGFGIKRVGVEDLLQVSVTRDYIKVSSVRKELFGDRYGYLRISNFQSDTTDQARQALRELAKAADGQLGGMVLDLRSNPGGVLNAAVGVSDLFLSDGLIVSTRGRDRDAELSFNATPDDITGNSPMVVLVDEGSASASEIVAGALQDHKRAVIMGSQTFGKGSIQTIVPLRNGGAVKLTTGRYYTPAGRSIQAQGVTPDIVVPNATIEQAASHRPKEADLAGHLDGNEEVVEVDMKIAELATTDFALYEAINLLRGLTILGQSPVQPPPVTASSEN